MQMRLVASSTGASYSQSNPDAICLAVARDTLPRACATRPFAKAGARMERERNGADGTEQHVAGGRGLADRLRRVGQRVTPQRLVILGSLEPGEHLAADEVFARVEPLLPGV